jgi:hypothetical protein
MVGMVLVSPVLVAPMAAFASSTSPVPAACVVVNATPLHAQVGYAPNGPSDCTMLPPVR